jgi:FKBP-type peptidyl-prolyl cis-trans isomerase FkpA
MENMIANSKLKPLSFRMKWTVLKKFYKSVACGLNQSAYLAFLIIMTGCSCSGNAEREAENPGTGVQKEDLVRANQFLVGKDMDLIRAYAERRKWKVDFTSTGLGYQVYENGSGPEIEKGRTITLEYTLSLLDGRVCYSSEHDGLKTFRVGQGGVEAGLEEGVLMLRKGAKARFILPPFLGHGLIGDQNRIPPRAVLIYEVEVKDVSGT